MESVARKRRVRAQEPTERYRASTIKTVADSVPQLPFITPGAHTDVI